jgi:glycosyltransferase involved in cell wall biosynthesis
MKISLIICTRNRSAKLAQVFKCLESAYDKSLLFEVVVVDNNSTDDTQNVINSFINSSKLNIKNVFEVRTGSGHARNCGIIASSGDVLIFNDDDCYMEKDYIANFVKVFNPSECQYGMGSILVYSDDYDQRIARYNIKKKHFIAPFTPVIPAGLIQGANMFFLKEVFNQCGLFDENMGAGTKFVCEDIDMACRASHAGFTGGLLPGFAVRHDHGRIAGSHEAVRTLETYDTGRGSYYGKLLLNGSDTVWEFWGNETKNKDLSILYRELVGATSYLEMMFSKQDVNLTKIQDDKKSHILKQKLYSVWFSMINMFNYFR